TTTEIRLTMIGNGDSPNGNIAINQVTANLGAIGQLSVSDPDAGDTASFVSMTDAVGDYGTLNLSSDGSWTYVLDDSLTQVLTEDQVETESFTITAVDSQGETSTQNLSVTVNGPNNVPDVAGGDGDDTLLGTDGADLILGGAGNDILTGGAGSDVFDFNTADLGTGAVPTEDVITDFQAGQGGDVVDLRDILVDDSDPLDNYLSLNFENGDTTIEVKPSGDNDITQKIKLEGVDLTGYGGGVTDADILNNLIDEGNLQID
nr:VCBS domain-containing protein [Endozoicomonas sp.]